MGKYDAMEELAEPAGPEEDDEGDEEALDAAIDAALRGDGSAEDKREAFKRAVAACMKGM